MFEEYADVLTAEEASEEGILQTICDHFLQNTKRE